MAIAVWQMGCPNAGAFWAEPEVPQAKRAREADAVPPAEGWRYMANDCLSDLVLDFCEEVVLEPDFSAVKRERMSEPAPEPAAEPKSKASSGKGLKQKPPAKSAPKEFGKHVAARLAAHAAARSAAPIGAAAPLPPPAPLAVQPSYPPWQSGRQSSGKGKGRSSRAKAPVAPKLQQVTLKLPVRRVAAPPAPQRHEPPAPQRDEPAEAETWDEAWWEAEAAAEQPEDPQEVPAASSTASAQAPAAKRQRVRGGWFALYDMKQVTS